MELQKWFNRKLKDSDTVEELVEAFKVFDSEGRNLISVAEMRHIMMNMGDKMTEDEIVDFIKDADPAGDGWIHYENIASYMLPDK